MQPRDPRSSEAEGPGDARANPLQQFAGFLNPLGRPRQIANGGEPWPQLAHFGTYFTPACLVLFSVPVIESFCSDHHADTAEIRLVRARVVDDVRPAVARAVGKHR